MVIFPPAAALTLLLDGRSVPAYGPVFLSHGRLLGPVDPYVTRVADTISYARGFAIFARDGHRVRVRLFGRDPGELSRTYVPLGPLLRALGARVRVDRAHRVAYVTLPPREAVRSPAPYDPLAPQAPPSLVFTPAPEPTERPVWTGPPEPRRTPIPAQFWATPPP